MRFAATLDEPDTRILILQGESGIGKSSFLRAGVIPYLEEQCIGYRLLRRHNDKIRLPRTRSGRSHRACSTRRRSRWSTRLRTRRRSGSTSASRLTKSWGALPITPRSARRLARDASLFSTLLARMAAPLPHALVLSIDQAEEFFTFSRSSEEI